MYIQTIKLYRIKYNRQKHRITLPIGGHASQGEGGGGEGGGAGHPAIRPSTTIPSTMSYYFIAILTQHRTKISACGR